MIENLSPTKHKVLEALAKYRYMTVKQFILAGVSESPQYLNREVLKPLYERTRGKLIECAKLGFEPGRGVKPPVYCLTKHGAHIVAEYERCEVADIPYPRGGMQYARDFYHREAYIDALILFHHWIEQAGGTVFSEKHYFDTKGSNRKGTQSRAETRLTLKDNFLVPDGLTDFEVGGKRRPAALEVHNHTDPKRCTKQLEKHMLAIRQQAVAGIFGQTGGNLVFSLTTSRSLAERIRARMLEVPGFSHFLPIFRFACLEDVRADYGAAWVFADGKPAPLA